MNSIIEQMLKEHHQELTLPKKWIYRYLGRHLMNRNVKKIRNHK